MGDSKRHNLYVIELDKAVLNERKFVEANPDHVISQARSRLETTWINKVSRGGKRGRNFSYRSLVLVFLLLFS